MNLIDRKSIRTPPFYPRKSATLAPHAVQVKSALTPAPLAPPVPWRCPSGQVRAGVHQTQCHLPGDAVPLAPHAVQVGAGGARVCVQNPKSKIKNQKSKIQNQK
jgi:hypothetical protein